jgi:hypothetical protein
MAVFNSCVESPEGAPIRMLLSRVAAPPPIVFDVNRNRESDVKRRSATLENRTCHWFYLYIWWRKQDFLLELTAFFHALQL